MPSAALLKWQNERLPSLAQVDLQCGASVAAVPANLALIDENYRGYVLIIMAKKIGKNVVAHTMEVARMLPIGARVKIPNLGGQIGTIVEFRGGLGPKGARIYRVLLRRKPRRDYIELRDDQLELVETRR